MIYFLNFSLVRVFYYAGINIAIICDVLMLQLYSMGINLMFFTFFSFAFLLMIVFNYIPMMVELIHFSDGQLQKLSNFMKNANYKNFG